MSQGVFASPCYFYVELRLSDYDINLCTEGLIDIRQRNVAINVTWSLARPLRCVAPVSAAAAAAVVAAGTAIGAQSGQTGA